MYVKRITNKKPKQAQPSAAVATVEELMTNQQPRPHVQLSLFTPSLTMHVDPRCQVLFDTIASRIDKSHTMKRYAALSTESVFERLTNVPSTTSKYQTWTFADISTTVTPKRMHAFAANMSCVCCGREANIFLVEHHKNDTNGHYLNLYSAGRDGLVLMTVDHILCDSMGGKYSPDNFQTMCQECNQQKGCMMSAADVALVAANPKKYAKSWMPDDLVLALMTLQLSILTNENPGAESILSGAMVKARKKIRVNMTEAQVNGIIHSIHKAATTAENQSTKPIVVTVAPDVKLTFWQRVIQSLRVSNWSSNLLTYMH